MRFTTMSWPYRLASRLRASIPSPTRAEPNRPMEAGSGTPVSEKSPLTFPLPVLVILTSSKRPNGVTVFTAGVPNVELKALRAEDPEPMASVFAPPHAL